MGIRHEIIFKEMQFNYLNGGQGLSVGDVAAGGAPTNLGKAEAEHGIINSFDKIINFIGKPFVKDGYFISKTSNFESMKAQSMQAASEFHKELRHILFKNDSKLKFWNKEVIGQILKISILGSNRTALKREGDREYIVNLYSNVFKMDQESLRAICTHNLD